jgi:hypothetical protein
MICSKARKEVVAMKKKLAVLAAEDDLLVDLTLNNVPASLLTEFAEKIGERHTKVSITEEGRTFLTHYSACNELLPS